MQKTAVQKRKLAELIGEGVPIREAMIKAGWSVTQANKGWQKVPRSVIKALPKKAQRFIESGKAMLAEDQQALIKGRLIANITQGTDKGAQSAKILGQSKENNMWIPDQQTGVIVIGSLQPHLEEKARKLLEES